MKKNASVITALLCSLYFTGPAMAQSPVFDWAVTAGGSGMDYAHTVAVDPAGNVYSAGFFNGTVDFDNGPAVHNLASNGSSDIFVMKTGPNGNFIWAKSIGSSGIDLVNSIAVSPGGYLYLTGYFYGQVDFDPGPGIDTLTNADHPCNTEIYILKLDTAGNHVWARSVRGVVSICTDATDVGYAIQLDQQENVYLTGFFRGHADFDPAPADSFMLTVNGPVYSEDIFVLKLDSSGHFRFAKQIGCTLGDVGYAAHVSSAGEIYITGLYGCPVDFDPGQNVSMINNFGNWDMFLLKLDTAGNYNWAFGIGGSGDDRGYGLTTDAAGNVYVTGHYTGTVDFDPSAGICNLVAPSGQRGIFLLKVGPQGNLIWAKGIAGAGGGERSGTAVHVGINNHVFVTGYFTETIDFDPSPLPADTLFLTAPGTWTNTDAFLLETDTAGDFIWAGSFGSTGADRGKAVATDGSGNIYSAGYFAGTVDFDPGPGITAFTGNGNNDAYLLKLAPPSVPSSGSAQAETTLQARLAPNPSGSSALLLADLSLPDALQVLITDLSGKKIRTIEAPAEILHRICLPAELAPGIYFVTVTGKSCGTKTVKWIRQ